MVKEQQLDSSEARFKEALIRIAELAIENDNPYKTLDEIYNIAQKALGKEAFKIELEPDENSLDYL